MIHWLLGAIATFRFELLRSFTYQRTAVSVVLALFPPVMVILIFGASQIIGQVAQPEHISNALRATAPFAIIFLVSLVCLLSLLLWASPNVLSELEGKSWGFVACRPGGRMALYLGKYFAAVGVSFLISIVALSACVLITQRMRMLVDPEQYWRSLAGIYFIASLGYGAIFSMIGTIFYKRSMVVAAGFLVFSEVFLASIPAVLSKFTLRFHLQELGIKWIGFFLPGNSEQEYRILFGPVMPVWQHLLAIGIGTAIALLIGAIVITNRQYITSEEN